MSDLSRALVPYRSPSVPRTRNISCAQENIPETPSSHPPTHRRRHHSQPVTLSVTYFYQQPYNFYLRARVVMDRNYNFEAFSPFNRSGNGGCGHFSNSYIPLPYPIGTGPTQGGGGSYSQPRQQSQPQPQPRPQQQQQPNYWGMDQQQQQNYFPQNQAPNVNHYHGSNFNFFFGGAGGYDLNIRMQGVGQNQNYEPLPEMGGQK